jgi:hypothetical protein
MPQWGSYRPACAAQTLDFERSGIHRVIGGLLLLEDVIAYAKQAPSRRPGYKTLWDVPLIRGANRQCRTTLDVPIPVRLVAPGRCDDAFSGRGVVVKHFEHGLVNVAATSADMREHQELVPENPTEAQPVQHERRSEDHARQEAPPVLEQAQRLES